MSALTMKSAHGLKDYTRAICWRLWGL